MPIRSPTGREFNTFVTARSLVVRSAGPIGERLHCTTDGIEVGGHGAGCCVVLAGSDTGDDGVVLDVGLLLPVGDEVQRFGLPRQRVPDVDDDRLEHAVSAGPRDGGVAVRGGGVAYEFEFEYYLKSWRATWWASGLIKEVKNPGMRLGTKGTGV